MKGRTIVQTGAQREEGRQPGDHEGRFLGQFLVSRNIVSEAQVLEAIAMCSSVNRRCGQLAVARGLMTAEQVIEINRAQRLEDALFGEIAQRMGLLTAEQCSELLRVQSKHRLRLRDALLQLGSASSGALELACEEFAFQEQEIRRLSALPIPHPQQGAIGYLREHALILLLRLAQIDVKLGVGDSWTGEQAFEFQVMIDINAESPLIFGICLDHGFGCALAIGMLGIEPEECDTELVGDVLNEYANMLAGQTKRFIKGASSALIGLPQPGRSPDSGFMFPLVTPRGDGALIISS